MRSEFRYLLDTDTSSYIIRRIAGPVARAMQFREQFAISSITRFELGRFRSDLKLAKSRWLLDEFLLEVPTLEFDAIAADVAAATYRDLAAKGEPIGITDSMLAGHALAEDLTFVTNNQKHFSRVPGLRLRNWLE